MRNENLLPLTANVFTLRDQLHFLVFCLKRLTKPLNLNKCPLIYASVCFQSISLIVPLVSRMCPSDICRVWKQGPNVRIDASLIGFNGTSSWIRGNMSYIFRITGTCLWIRAGNCGNLYRSCEILILGWMESKAGSFHEQWKQFVSVLICISLNQFLFCAVFIGKK